VEPHTVVVIGASAGGVETLVRVVKDLPADLAATVCIVLHIAPGSPSALPSILQRAGVMPCRSAIDGEEMRDGEILVAPPDHHLVVSDGHVLLTLGPRENGHRPAVDPLFRSAATAQDGKVVGVILSGTRDDGTAGLAMIKAHGGMAIVQDPAEALYPGMPASALAHVDVDAVVPSSQIAETIVRVVNGDLDPVGSPGTSPPPGGNPGPTQQHGKGETVEQRTEAGTALTGQAVTTTCPECGGVLQEYREAGVTQWRCRVGHRYSPESLADAQGEGVEAALWAAIRALDDREALLRRMAEQLETTGNPRSASSFRRRAREAAQQSRAVRSVLGETAATTVQKVSDSEDVEAERRGAA
jgi:two-component system, chemotaxis family, protein-glutamate methylesterase/glutaminase